MLETISTCWKYSAHGPKDSQYYPAGLGKGERAFRMNNSRMTKCFVEALGISDVLVSDSLSYNTISGGTPSRIWRSSRRLRRSLMS